MLFTNHQKKKRINETRQNTIKPLNTAPLDYYKLNPKNITHAANIPGRERKSVSKRARKGER